MELPVNRFSNKILILYSSVGEEYFGISTNYAAFVGANSFAHNSFNVRINSHLLVGMSNAGHLSYIPLLEKNILVLQRIMPLL